MKPGIGRDIVGRGQLAAFVEGQTRRFGARLQDGGAFSSVAQRGQRQSVCPSNPVVSIEKRSRQEVIAPDSLSSIAMPAVRPRPVPVGVELLEGAQLPHPFAVL